MTDLENLLRETMTEHAEGVPEHPDLAQSIVRRGRRRRRHQVTAAVAAGVAALALAVPAVLQLLPQQAAAPAGQHGQVQTGATEDLTPGMTRVTFLSEPVSAQHTGTASVELGPRPGGATGVSTLLDCTDAGEFTWPDGAAMVCHSANPDATAPTHLAEGGYVIDLAPGQDSIDIEASDGASWWITTAYVSTEVTPWAVNAKGETYGVDNENGTPDLIATEATNGKAGYTYDKDLRKATGPAPTSPDDALARQEANKGNSVSIPVYESDGETVIGDVLVHNESNNDGVHDLPATTTGPQAAHAAQEATALIDEGECAGLEVLVGAPNPGSGEPGGMPRPPKDPVFLTGDGADAPMGTQDYLWLQAEGPCHDKVVVQADGPLVRADDGGQEPFTTVDGVSTAVVFTNTTTEGSDTFTIGLDEPCDLSVCHPLGTVTVTVHGVSAQPTGAEITAPARP